MKSSIVLVPPPLNECPWCRAVCGYGQKLSLMKFSGLDVCTETTVRRQGDGEEG